jgi:large subunit ribosomal protein L9
MKKLLLMTDIKNLGKEGEIAEVSDGYARNYLIPEGKAVPVSKGAMKHLEKIRLDKQAKAQEELEQARGMADKLKDVSCTIAVKVSENEQLFGSVTVADISTALHEQKIELDPKQILLDQPIRQLGIYNVDVHLHDELTSTVKVWIVSE